MKYFVCAVAAIATLSLTSCQESLEDRCARECNEYNTKKCPAKISEGITIDSLVFERASHTLHYYSTFSGLADNPEVVNGINPRKVLIDEVRNSPNIKTYKDAGYNFHYTYFSASRKSKLADVLVMEKDYK